ncbi:MAG: hypothetical protein KDA37_11400, partial [Planctomycetales bacterium]|nr:hypothetical protein [Planctomycetales bacterium]
MRLATRWSSRTGGTGIIRGAFQFCWRLLKWGVTTALILVGVVGAYLYFKLDDEIARYAQAFLADHYQQLDVRIAGARYEHGVGVILSGVALSAPRVERPPEPLLEIAELRLIGSFTKESLTTRKPRIDRIEIHRPRLMATRRASGAWSVESLLPPPAGDGSPTPVHIYDATVVLSDEAQPAAQPLTLQNIDLRLNHTPTVDGGQRLEIRGRAEETLARLIDVQGEADPASGRLNLVVQVQQLGVTTERLLAAPGVPRLWLTGVSVNGQVDSMTTIRRESLMAPIDWQCNFTLNQGALSHPLLPKQMTDVQVQGYCDPKGVRIDKATAKSGEAELNGMLNSMGWGPEARASCQINVNGLALGPGV